MREIKFRFWDDENKKMMGQSVDLLVESDGQVWQNVGVDKDELIMVDFAPLQFTGLKDKNGVDIYEGDIIRIISTNDIREVIYHKCGFGIALNENIFAPIYWHGDIEVLGNIYENQNLLFHV